MDMNQCKKYTKPEIKLTNLYSCIQYLAHLENWKGKGELEGKKSNNIHFVFTTLYFTLQ